MRPTDPPLGIHQRYALKEIADRVLERGAA